MLKFEPNQKIYVSRTEKGEQFEAYILSSVNNTLIISRPKIVLGENKYRYIDYLNQMNLIYGRYMYNGIEYFFKTIVLKSNFTPFPHIILKYPEEKHIKYKKLRKYDRHSCVLPVKISRTDRTGEIMHENVFAVDISYSGIGIVCNERLPKNFVGTFDAGKTKISLTCEIKVLKANKFKNFHLYGCDIIENSDVKSFREYIDILKILNT
jgi:c-di-GMP-binding flagellar brake protein YcgR